MYVSMDTIERKILPVESFTDAWPCCIIKLICGLNFAEAKLLQRLPTARGVLAELLSSIIFRKIMFNCKYSENFMLVKVSNSIDSNWMSTWS